MSDRAKKVQELMRNMHALGRKAAFRPKGAFKMPITPAQFGALRLIRDRGTCSVKDVALSLGITSSAATQLADGLIEKGYIVKDEHAHDRRSVELRLSAKAEKQGHAMEAEAAKHLIKLFEALSDKEFDLFTSLIEKIVQRFSA